MNQILAVVLLVAVMLLEAQLVNGLSCGLGSVTLMEVVPPEYTFAECPASATYCGVTETTLNNGSITYVASCQDDVVACDQLCAGVPNCWSACCNDEPNCNRKSTKIIVYSKTCMTGTTTNGSLSEKKTCQESELCARREVTTDGVTTTTGMCSIIETCNMLCNNFTNCVSACCYDADECNARPVSDITNIVRCVTKWRPDLGDFQFSTCAPGYQCGRIEDGNQTETEVSCQTATACDAGLCGNRTNCVSACCQNDECNMLSVAELNVRGTTTLDTTTATTTPTTTTATTTPTTTTTTTTATTTATTTDTATTTPTTTTPTTTTATTSGAEHAAQINILMTMCLAVFGWFVI